MEIPAGRRCGKCVLLQYDSDDCLFYCMNPKFRSIDGPLSDELVGSDPTKGDSWKAVRCDPCLSAYPHGATVRIEAKEGK